MEDLIIRDRDDHMDNLVNETYNDTKRGYWGKTKMYDKIMDRLDKQKALQVHKLQPARVKRKKFDKIDAKMPLASIQMDIMVVKNLQHPLNHNVGYILLVIDVYSRYVFYKTLVHRRKTNIHQALREIFNEMKGLKGMYPQNVTVDNEFRVDELSREFGFKVYHSDPYEKYRTAMVERFI